MKAQFRSEFSHIHEKILEVKLKNTRLRAEMLSALTTTIQSGKNLLLSFSHELGSLGMAHPNVVSFLANPNGNYLFLSVRSWYKDGLSMLSSKNF